MQPTPGRAGCGVGGPWPGIVTMSLLFAHGQLRAGSGFLSLGWGGLAPRAPLARGRAAEGLVKAQTQGFLLPHLHSFLSPTHFWTEEGKGVEEVS